MRPRVLAVALLGAALCGAADYQSLYDQKQLFDLRDAVAQASAPPFFRAVVACAFGDEQACVGETRAALDSRPAPELAGKLYDLLADFYSARGRWPEVVATADAEQASTGVRSEIDWIRALARRGPVRVERAQHSTIRVLYKFAHVPIRVDGRSYRAFLDTGANISVMTESAARRLGLAVEKVELQFGGSAGKTIDIRQVAVADRFTIGKIDLRNVPFLIVSDRQEPFRSWGAGKRCIVGIQVLLAARNVTWKGRFPFATVELARPAEKRDLAAANFCWDGKTPLVSAEYQGRRATIFLDTGAGNSVFYGAFAGKFPVPIATAPHVAITFSGIDGDKRVEAAILRELPLRVGGRDLRFRRAAVYLKGHDRAYDGMFGNDLAGKAREFTIDFEAMRVLLR